MSDLNVTERRIRPIYELVNSRSWKQALQQCEKWQKKGEKSDRFLALKALVLINQPEKPQVARGRAETLELCHRRPAVTDIEALDQLRSCLKHLSLHNEEGPKLWERAIAARPDDKDLLTNLLNGCISENDWMGAQKAAMALRKASPKDRQYDFLNMLLCYLINQDELLPQKEREMFGRLAYMLVSKSAEAVPTNEEEVLTTGKAIATPEELSLLVKIFIASGHASEAVQVLQSTTLGLQSRVAEPDPQFVFSLLLEALNNSKNTEDTLQQCETFIESGSSISKQHREDDRVWKILLSCSKGGNASKDNRRECLRIAQSVYQSDPQCRAAYLAHFDLINSATDDSTETDYAANADACVAYFNAFSNKPFCFSDLVGPLLSNQPTLERFNSRVVYDTNNTLHRAFQLKLKHACLDTKHHKTEQGEYLRLATDAILLHKELSITKSECPEMILLAATALLRFALKEGTSIFNIQASYLLQNCYSKFTEYYPIAIRQVQLYLTQGQISLALEKFTKLAVKNMQWETVGHLLLSRISTLHPWQLTSSINPLKALDDGLEMLEAGDRSINRAIHEGIKNSSYSNVIDSVQVRDKMVKSMNRQVYIVEERRIQRFVGVPHDLTLSPYPANMVDQRDFSFVPFLGQFSGLEELETSLSCGPLPRNAWLLAMALHDHLTTYLKAELGAQLVLASSAFDLLKTNLDKTRQPDVEWSAELTTSELSCLKCHQALSEVLLAMKETVSNQTDINKLITQIKSWLEDEILSTTQNIANINGIDTPTWQFLHNSYSRLETVQTISLFLSLQARKSKSSKSGKAFPIAKDELMELQRSVSTAEKRIHDHAKRLKDSVNAAGILGKLTDAAAGRLEELELAQSVDYKALSTAYADLVDEVALEEFCGRLKDSWDEALMGILKMKIVVVK